MLMTLLTFAKKLIASSNVVLGDLLVSPGKNDSKLKKLFFLTGEISQTLPVSSLWLSHFNETGKAVVSHP